LKNALIIENLRRTVRPLKHYYSFLKNIDISTRSASRLRLVGERDMKTGIITKNLYKLPNSYATLEVILRLTDAEINTNCRSGKITQGSSRKDMEALTGSNAVKDTSLKADLKNTSKFADIRIEKGYNDEAKLMRLLKDIKKLKEKYAFIDTLDRGYVDRIKKKRRAEELRTKQGTVTDEEVAEAKKVLEGLKGNKSALRRKAVEDFFTKK